MLRPSFPRLSHPRLAQAIPSIACIAHVYLGENPRFSPKISEVKATDQQRPAQAPLADAHEALDAAVAAAYGWSADISDDEVLRELLALNGGLETEQ